MKIAQTYYPEIPAWKAIVKSIPLLVVTETGGFIGFITKYWLWLLVAIIILVYLFWWFFYSSKVKKSTEVKQPEKKDNEPTANSTKPTLAFSVVTPKVDTPQ